MTVRQIKKKIKELKERKWSLIGYFEDNVDEFRHECDAVDIEIGRIESEIEELEDELEYKKLGV